MKYEYDLLKKIFSGPQMSEISRFVNERETLDSEDINSIIKGKKLDKLEKVNNKVDSDTKDKPRSSVPTNPGRIKPGHQPST